MEAVEDQFMLYAEVDDYELPVNPVLNYKEVGYSSQI